MSMPVCRALLAVALGASARAGSQRPSLLPPIRPIGRIVARAAEPLGSVAGIRVLSDGRVMVDDRAGRQVLLFDSTLAHAQHIMDTLGTTVRAYPQRGGALLPFEGDSALYLDPNSLAFLVIAPSGGIARIMSAPTSMVGDRDGPLEYVRGGHLLWGLWLTHPVPPVAPPGTLPPTLVPDTGVIFRGDFASHRIDTVGFFAIPRTYANVSQTDSTGWVWSTRTMNPIPVQDQWGSLADGTIVIARAQDYHLDWISPDGAHTSSPKLPHEWVRLSDSAKEAAIDSVRVRYTDPRNMSHQSNTRNGVTRTRTYVPNFPDPADLPDYPPPFGSVQGVDAEGNLWIGEFTTNPGGATVFDVIDRAGRMVDRVRTPGGTTVVGWAPGAVYLTSRDGTTTSLVRARLR